MSEVLAHVIRGGEVESVHRGDLVVLDREDNILYSVGDPYGFTYWRSAAKPFQILPMIEAGGIGRFGFTGEELAVMTSSHGGEERHVETVKSILGKMGLGVEALDCGTAAPMYHAAAADILRKNGEFSQLHNPCSGKHCGMLALALLKGYDIRDYIRPEHAVQREMLDVVADITGLDKEDIIIGTDGCGVPVFALPIYYMARAYSKLARPQRVEGRVRSDALREIGKAMTGHPYFVAGTKRLDTVLMEVTGGRLVAKLGAEAVYCIGVMGEGLAVALKIEDGGYRAIDPVVVELLRRLDLITAEEFDRLRDRWEVRLINHRKDTIGVIKAAF